MILSNILVNCLSTEHWPKLVINRPMFYLKNLRLFTSNDFLPPSFKNIIINMDV